MYECYKLNNKARVILVPLNTTQSVTTLIMYPVGSRYEPERLNGVSHYIEHLMFKGTKKRKSTLLLTREIDRLGAEYNAFTGKECTGYYIQSDASKTSVSLDILSDMLFQSLFDPKEMQREKGVIVEELRMYKDNPVMNIDMVFEERMFKGCPLGWDEGGTEAHVLGYKRPHVLNYRETHYLPENMTVILAGNIPDEAPAWIQTYFGAHHSRKKVNTKYLPASFGPGKKEERIVVERKHTDQAQLMLGFPGFHYNHIDNPALTVLNTILGGSMSSRLFIQIRERRGLAYTVRSGADNFLDTGYTYVRAGLEVKNINTAIRVIKSEIEKMVARGASPKELADAKTHIRGSMSLALEHSSAQADWYGRQALFMKKIETPEERLEKIDAVTNADIQRVGEHLFNWDKIRVAVIGDVEKERVIF